MFSSACWMLSELNFIHKSFTKETLKLSVLRLIVKYTQRTASQMQIMSNPRLNFTVSYSSPPLVLGLV